MQQQLQQRLETLKAEFNKGEIRLQELENEASNLRTTLLRIGGAIQVLTEELEKVEQEKETGNQLNQKLDQ